MNEAEFQECVDKLSEEQKIDFEMDRARILRLLKLGQDVIARGAVDEYGEQHPAYLLLKYILDTAKISAV